MSCNGCRVLRKGCSETCVLRSCLHWISTPEAQGNATLFLAKFFGRSDLISLISAVPESQRPGMYKLINTPNRIYTFIHVEGHELILPFLFVVLFQSLLFEACGRTVNPVNGAVGLLWSGNWHVCQAAVESVLSGETLRPLPGILTGVSAPNCDESSDSFSAAAYAVHSMAWNQSKPFDKENNNQVVPDHHVNLCLARGRGGRDKRGRDAVSFYTGGESETTSFESSGADKKKLLNLFV
ncbi:LOB domain-containing protein 38-like [Populus alba x Populus x berolinensis]|uniref:LOB domain-containing protein 38-like n=1 Tax=Populus alba x Populus x berolinensis TaxID=444605 RepID=A0AAD6PYR2_9ROSI|nr:LOB domain-containing protein 38-like [Populus alba x Populus x berolinensis]KAJ6971570.1 LOB domain-containing protein 38-like [Populus alba x Populus x berolinensis]